MDRRTELEEVTPRQEPSRPRTSTVNSSRRKVSAVVVAAFALASFVAALMVYPGPVASWESHAPIYIASDSDFTTDNGVTGGSGSEADPYIISGWEIYGDEYAGIDIEGTTAYFEIRDVHILYEGGSIVSGVYFYGVSNGTVEDSVFDGIDCGIEAEYSENVTAESNSFNGCINPLWFYFADNCRLWNNTMSGGTNGIYLFEVFSFDVTGNSVSATSYEGIYGYYVHGTLFSSNTVSDCNGPGIFLDFSSGSCVIYNNTLSNNDDLAYGLGGGVFLDGCTGIIVYHNSFLGNTPAQAYDFGVTGNSWNLASPVGGNYWDDYLGEDLDTDGFGDTPYAVEGGAQDALPLMVQPGTGTPIPEFSSLVGPVLAVMAMFLLVRRRWAG